MKKIRVGIIGGAGYTGGELIRLLLWHPNAELIFVHSSSNAGKLFHVVHKDLIGDSEMRFTEVFDDSDIDVLFLCSGHGHSKKFFEVHKIKNDLKIIDLSQDFRLAGNYFRKFTYGLVEANRAIITEAQNIANPGCFATCLQLGMLPLAKEGILQDDIHISAVTGSTGAGQSLSATSHFSWRNNNMSVYKAFKHQHLLEIRENIGKWQQGYDNHIHFVPYRGTFTRGIIASIYTRLDVALEELQALYREYYSTSPFVHVSDANIDLKQVVNTNKGLLYLEKHDDMVLIVSIIDNLLKGASGQAVQNMNLMFGLDEQAGLNLKATGF